MKPYRIDDRRGDATSFIALIIGSGLQTQRQDSTGIHAACHEPKELRREKTIDLNRGRFRNVEQHRVVVRAVRSQEYAGIFIDYRNTLVVEQIRELPRDLNRLWIEIDVVKLVDAVFENFARSTRCSTADHEHGRRIPELRHRIVHRLFRPNDVRGGANEHVVLKEVQLNFFENNMLVGSTSDVVGAEEPVHYAMSQLRNPTSVLMVGGAASGAPREVLKYSIDKLDYVDLNPQSIQVTRQFTDLLNDQRITVVNEDPRVFLRANGPNYDAVLLNVPEPSTIQINRLFTTEFFGLVASRMNAGGVLSLGLQPGTDYQSDEARSVTSTIVNAIRLHFGDVLLVPGQRTYLLASDSVLDIRIGHLIRQRGIPTLYVNDSYLDDGDLERRSALLEEALDSSAPVNADLSPVSYYRHMVYWLTYFRSHLGIVAFFAIVLIMLATGKANVVTAGLLTSGFAASCIEVLLLVAFQTLYGYVYQMIGVIVTVFMGGLAVGALLRPKLVPSVSRRAYMMAQIGITAYALVLLLFLSELDRFSGASFLTLTLFMVLTFAIAALVGIVFSIAAELRAGDATAVASELYGVDLLGSALGALLVATILIPAAGFEGVCLIVGALTLLSGLLVTRKSGSTIVTG